MKHAVRADGIDMTLCGLSLDGDDGNGSAPVPELAKRADVVECKECQRIISHCQAHFTHAYRYRP